MISENKNWVHVIWVRYVQLIRIIFLLFGTTWSTSKLKYSRRQQAVLLRNSHQIQKCLLGAGLHESPQGVFSNIDNCNYPTLWRVRFVWTHKTAYEVVVVAWCEQNRAELCNDCLSDGYLPLQTRRALCTIHPVFFPQPTHFFPKI